MTRQAPDRGCRICDLVSRLSRCRVVGDPPRLVMAVDGDG